jgi:hypothetical protein
VKAQAMRQRMKAVVDGKVIEAQPITEKEQGKSPLSDGGLGAAEGSGQAKGSSWRD